MTIQLYSHQQKELERNCPKSGLWHGTGSGKTVTAIELANKNANSVLVVVPNLGGMLIDKWQKAINNYGRDGIIWKIITKETFRRDFKSIPYYDALIWDEAHALGNEKSQMNRAARAWIKVLKPKFVWLLTATPFLSDAPASVLSYGHILGRDDWKWTEFRSRFYKERYIGRRVIFEPRKDIESDLAALMREIGSVVSLSDCYDVPDHIIEEELFEPTKEQISLTEKLSEMESNPLTRHGKNHQIAQGILLGNEYMSDQFVHSYKNDRILEIVSKHKKVAIFAKYNAQIEYIANLMAENDIPHSIINGESKDKAEKGALLESSPRCVAIINSACAVGYELPSFEAIIYASCSWSYIDHEQSLGRFDRINKEPMKRVIYYLMTKGSIDEDVLISLKKKESFSLALHIKMLDQ